MSIPPDTADHLEPDTAGVAEPGEQKGNKRKTKRFADKGLLLFALIFTTVLVLSEPWLLVPMGATAVALALWD
jgi:hypothetical protein